MKKEDIIFYEYQRLQNKWLTLSLIPINLIFFYLTISQLLLNPHWENNLLMKAIFVILNIILILLSVNTLWINMITVINKEGILVHVKLCPFYTKCKSYSWDDISRAYVRRYLPFWEYGGYGIKFGRKGVAYNMSGNIGMQLVLQNNKRVLIGTQKCQELLIALRDIENQKKSKE
jgi:hypothetical protein